ncbi:enoyl-CoA hydratase/isomerase family protein [Streptomyces endophyticus]|uniref:Enoyl-CoA hydratase-related protein n=1 Tax=Streptomyces endophyticus TaxID=714166 RepID=A0ABU6EWU1_9ACTN|nr:enoyl-CoA hydratase-related protein [Streptomyces endophyticus]MEB8336213.1 enoyl-CoA hydratase-related protein [Streptomyces endophyticus]
MSDENVLIRERSGNVLVARLNRPGARNALTPELMAALGRALLDAESDPDIRAVVLTGSGDRVFCPGMDLRAFANGTQMGLGDDPGRAAYQRFTGGGSTIPVVGAANGSALGGGMELLLACDVVVASETAKFGFPEVKRGLFPAGGGAALGTRIPLAHALELVLTGDPVDARRAHEIGLVNTVVGADHVLSAALELAGRIAANAPLGLSAVKELVRTTLTDPDRAAARERELQRSVFGSEDAKEGATAFMEKRAPVWRGC